jgi:hypothetical protein
MEMKVQKEASPPQKMLQKEPTEEEEAKPEEKEEAGC